ncbi:hypothetical protein [Stackebrandtia soli]|uniref:hypothetical protein n=1 Tax=Stackebrandtia soli TaxID=1892856 RepID=UPI0039ECC983
MDSSISDETMTDLSSSFRFRATGTPYTDRYIVRGPRGTRAEFSGFRDGEFLFLISDQGWAGLDDEQKFELQRYFLSAALNQIWASCGNRIAWLFESATDAEALRDDIAALVDRCRSEFDGASISFHVVDASAVDGTPSDRPLLNSDNRTASETSTGVYLDSIGLVAIGRPIGFVNETQRYFLLEARGRPITVSASAGRVWLVLRTGPATTTRPLTRRDVERFDRRPSESISEALAELEACGLISEWADDEDATAALFRLRVLPLQTFASGVDGSSVAAVADPGDEDAFVTTPVSSRARALLTLGPACDDLSEAARTASRLEELGELNGTSAITEFARELPLLLARDVAYLDLPESECSPDSIPDSSPLDVEIAPASDLGFLAVGLIVDATAGRPTMIRVAGRLEPLDADESGLWRVVRGLNPFRGPNAPELQELNGVARHRRIRNVEATLDRLTRRGLVRRLQGADALRSLSTLRFHPLLAGLGDVTYRQSRTQTRRQWLLGTTHDERTLARLDDVKTAIWGATGSELPSLQHAVSLLVHEADLGEVSFILGHIRSMVDHGSAYLDTISGHGARNATEGPRS